MAIERKELRTSLGVGGVRARMGDRAMLGTFGPEQRLVPASG